MFEDFLENVVYKESRPRDKLTKIMDFVFDLAFTGSGFDVLDLVIDEGLKIQGVQVPDRVFPSMTGLNSFLAEIDCSRCSLQTLVGVATASFSVRSGLTTRSDFMERVRIAVGQREFDRCFKGLD